MTESQPTVMESLSYTLLAELSPVAVVVSSNAQWWCWIELPKSWILQRLINNKSAPSVAVVSWKCKWEGEEQNPSGNVAQLQGKRIESGRQFRRFSLLKYVAFRTLYDDEDGKEMTGVAWAFDRYQTWRVGWPELRDPSELRLRVRLTRFGFFSSHFL